MRYRERWTDCLSCTHRREAGIFSSLSEDEWRQARACYYGRITEVDKELGRLLDVLEQSGEMERTVVIVTADHGKYVGAHGLEGRPFAQR
eukprot:COSAG01_NODE_932_length_12651_cov_50.381741_10_plen_90_part_00